MPPDPSVAFTPSQSLGRWLGAVDALGGSEWSSSDQLRYVRSFLEQGIEGLARAEDARFDLLADCAMLASQNMQDARLHITDERLAELENPDSDASIGQFFVELGIILALELVVVATAGYAIPALIALAAAGARARRVRRLTEGLSHTLEGAVTKRQAASASLKALGEAVAEKEEAFYRFGRFFQWYEQPVESAGRALREAEREYAVGLAALETSEALEKAVAAALPAVPDAVPPSLTSAQLRKMLDGALQQATIGRVAEQVATDDAVRRLLAQPPDVAPGATDVFQTSTLVGRFLESNERERAEAARQWDAMRFHIRVLPDATLAGSEIAHTLLWQLDADPPPPTGPGPGPGAEDMQTIARGMEVALWLEWMQHIQALGVVEVSNVPFLPTPQEGEPRPGRVWEDIFVESFDHRPHSPTPGFTFERAEDFVQGKQYPGLRKLTDGHGRYLYGQFARDFFVHTPDARPKGLEFDQDRYANVDSADGLERADRLAEMKLLTIVFFNRLRANPTAIASSGDAQMQAARKLMPTLLEVPGNIVAQFFGSQPPTITPDATIPTESAPADPVQEALAESAAERVAHYDAAKLAAMVTDLDLLISQLPLEPVDDSAGLVARIAADDLKQKIEKQKEAVQKQYDTFVEHAAGQTALLDEVNAEYKARIQLLVVPPPQFEMFPSTP